MFSVHTVKWRQTNLWSHYSLCFVGNKAYSEVKWSRFVTILLSDGT